MRVFSIRQSWQALDFLLYGGARQGHDGPGGREGDVSVLQIPNASGESRAVGLVRKRLCEQRI